MKEVINLIIDLAELCYKSQHKLNEELIEILNTENGPIY